MLDRVHLDRSRAPILDRVPVRTLARIASGVALAAVGIAHFATPRPFIDHVPSPLPAPLAIVYATGAMELVLGAALALAPPGFRLLAGRMTAAYLVAVFPGNLYVAIAGIPVYPAAWHAWARLPLQPLFIAIVLWSTRR